MGRRKFGVLDTGVRRFRPASARLEQTGPCIIGNNGIGAGIIQTDVLVLLRLEVLVKHDGIFGAVHRLSLRIQDILTLLALFANGVFTDQQVRAHILRLHVIDVCHTLPGIRPIVKMTRCSKTRCHTRMRQKVPFAVLHKRNRYTDSTLVLRLGIERQVAGNTQIHRVTRLVRCAVTVRLGVPSGEIIVRQQSMLPKHYLRLTRHRITGFYRIAEMAVVLILHPLARIRRHKLQTSVVFVFIDIHTAPTVLTDNRCTSDDGNGISFLLHAPTGNTLSRIGGTEFRLGIKHGFVGVTCDLFGHMPHLIRDP